MAALVVVLNVIIIPALERLHLPELLVEAAWQVFLLLFVWLFATYDGLGVGSLNPGAKWNKRDGLWMALIILVFYVAGGACDSFLHSFRPDEEAWSAEIARSLKSLSPFAFGLVAISLALLVGVTEELAFRGYAMTRLRSCGLSPWASIFVSATAFGLVHVPDQGLLSAIEVGLFWGIPAGYYFHRRGSLLPLIVAHSLVDALWFVAIYIGPAQP